MRLYVCLCAWACWPSLARCGSQGNPDVGDYHLTQRTCASCRRDAGFSPFPLCCPLPALGVAVLWKGRQGEVVSECQCSRFKVYGLGDGHLCGRTDASSPNLLISYRFSTPRTQRKTLLIVGLTTDTSSSRTCWQDRRGRGVRGGASAARSVELGVWS